MAYSDSSLDRDDDKPHKRSASVGNESAESETRMHYCKLDMKITSQPRRCVAGQTKGPLLLLVVLACGSCGSPPKQVEFYSRDGKAGRDVHVDCDRDGEVLHLFLAAECRVVTDIWVTVTHISTDGGPNKILCSTNGTPHCAITVPIPPKSCNPAQQPTEPVPVDVTVPELSQYPGETIVEVGGKCDTKEVARGGTGCVVRRPQSGG